MRIEPVNGPNCLEAADELAGTRISLEFYRGIKAIAEFLKMHPRTVQDHLRDGKLPAKKDQVGRWVLTNLDYYRSLKDERRGE
jgi:hypothetical protein